MELKTNYVDSQYSQKKYKKTSIDSTTITLEDTTDYSPQGDYYGTEDLNMQNLTCNELNHNYGQIDELIRILRDERGITVANNSPASIMSALLTDQTAFYNSGIADAKAYIQNHPTEYGYVPYATYQAAKAQNDTLNGKRRRAQGYLTSIPAYNPPSVEPSYSFGHDPITDAEAQGARSSLNAFVGQIGTAFDSFYSSGHYQLESAATELSV